MFYCDTCAKENDWPTTMAVSFGKCEVCGAQARCNDRPAALLPVKKPKK